MGTLVDGKHLVGDNKGDAAEGRIGPVVFEGRGTGSN